MLPQVDQAHVGAVVRIVVVRVHADALGADGVGRWAERLRRCRVVDDGPDSGADEVGDPAVGCLVAHQVANAGHEVGAAPGPVRLANPVYLFLGCRLRRGQGRFAVAGNGFQVPGAHGEAEPLVRPVLRVAGLEFAHEAWVERRVHGGDAEIGRALKDRQLGGFVGNDRNRLDAGGTSAKNTDPSAAEVDRFVGP